MSHIEKHTISAWTEAVDSWFEANSGVTDRHGITHRNHVVRGVDAWSIAHRVGIMEQAYKNTKTVDAHIQTALEKVFPNVKFKDPKVY
jgi:hypothetical protein